MKRDKNSRSVSLSSSSKGNFPERHVMPMVNIERLLHFRECGMTFPRKREKEQEENTQVRS